MWQEGHRKALHTSLARPHFSSRITPHNMKSEQIALYHNCALEAVSTTNWHWQYTYGLLSGQQIYSKLMPIHQIPSGSITLSFHPAAVYRQKESILFCWADQSVRAYIWPAVEENSVVCHTTALTSGHYWQRQWHIDFCTYCNILSVFPPDHQVQSSATSSLRQNMLVPAKEDWDTGGSSRHGLVSPGLTQLCLDKWLTGKDVLPKKTEHTAGHKKEKSKFQP